ncbi:(2Fe-2S)-binding protein [Nakamurella leprariae]|uniref:(2Fe-2S)-binding protein n=1 Tax=Nakamurella leprariae TaxID=2803911 RepID=A0A938YEV0_9ACTN|nr:(2Fe-2S)-binding protein [Nakamurella leprariae]MBM9466473.1 (2Fe-2S)-binding protein [Nakamurella leprariae]
MDVELTVNGRRRHVDADPCRLLVRTLREDLGLTGTNVGCLTGDCGACTVEIDGQTAKSCSVLTGSAAGSEITTLEGVAGPDGELDAVQRIFWEEFAFQCGYCLPGMILVTEELLRREGEITDADITLALNGNLCRCTGYMPILRAVRRCVDEARAGAGSAGVTEHQEPA